MDEIGNCAYTGCGQPFKLVKTEKAHGRTFEIYKCPRGHMGVKPSRKVIASPYGFFGGPPVGP